MSPQTLQESYNIISTLDTADDIASYLAGLGIRGNREESNSCPLALFFHRYLDKNDSQDCEISVDGDQIYMVNAGGEEEKLFPCAKIMKDFIRKFDKGDYPQIDYSSYEYYEDDCEEF